MSDENNTISYMLSQERDGKGYSSLNRPKLDLSLEKETLEFLVRAIISKAALMVSQENVLNSADLNSIADPLSRKEVLLAQIIEIGEEKITLRCLIDRDDKRFQVRKFDREPFEGMIPLEIGTFVEIWIFTKPGERKFVYKSIDGSAIKELFEPENLFEEFIDSSMFKPLPSVSEDQL